MSISIKISLNEGLYLKEPQDSVLGRNIIKHSILMINDLGFEAFTFKKLAQEINSTEASIYRYFENKHVLLIYLVSWYWEWVNYLIQINTNNIEDPKEKLRIVIKSFVFASKENPAVDFVNESVLHDLVISEGMKVYHTKDVDNDNTKGFFSNYKGLVNYVAAIAKEINPEFKYPSVFASNLFELSNNHIYFARHLPRLTDVIADQNEYDTAEEILNYFAEKLLA
jgi:AcrR family transcriptional regulator